MSNSSTAIPFTIPESCKLLRVVSSAAADYQVTRAAISPAPAVGAGIPIAANVVTDIPLNMGGAAPVITVGSTPGATLKVFAQV